MFDNRKRLLTLLLLAALILSFFTLSISSSDSIRTSARSAALYEPETKKFVYEKNSRERLGMASTTKIMTALIALENLSPNEPVEIDKRAVGIEGSSVYLAEGEIMTAVDLVYSLLLQSANDAAAALAYRIAGTIEDFAHLMNEKAREIGLYDTNFTNPHGLDGKEHYTTARDLAVLSAEALSNTDFLNIASTRTKKIQTNLKDRTLVNHNKMLASYKGCIGVKTGYTKKCGRCLVSAAERDGLRLISVTINAPDDWRDHTKMLDYGYSTLEARYLCAPFDYSFSLPVLNTKEKVLVTNTEGLKIICKKSDRKVTEKIELSRYFTPPISKGDKLGSVVFTIGGKTVGRVDLVAENGIKTQKRKNFKI